VSTTEATTADLEPQLQELLDAAETARRRAHAPYSDFAMGAAVRTLGGDIIPGALVENVSLGLAMCAERVALFSSVASGAGPVEALALMAPRTDGVITMPCGACLQVARELGGPDLVIVCADLEGAVVRSTLRQLAPHLPSKHHP
jgi:cytidine deaminase